MRRLMKKGRQRYALYRMRRYIWFEEPRVVLPGDDILVTCTYDTTDREEGVFCMYVELCVEYILRNRLHAFLGTVICCCFSKITPWKCSKTSMYFGTSRRDAAMLQLYHF